MLPIFLILDCEVDFDVPIIFGRPCLSTGRALVDMEKGQMKFWLNNEEVTFNICRSMRQSGEIQSISAISYRVEKSLEVQIEERLGVEKLTAVIINFDSNCIEIYGSLVGTLDRGDVQCKPKKLELDMKHHVSPLAKPSLEEEPKVEVKALPPHLRYVLLGKGNTLSVIIASDLNVHQVRVWWMC